MEIVLLSLPLAYCCSSLVICSSFPEEVFVVGAVVAITPLQRLVIIPDWAADKASLTANVDERAELGAMPDRDILWDLLRY